MLKNPLSVIYFPHFLLCKRVDLLGQIKVIYKYLIGKYIDKINNRPIFNSAKLKPGNLYSE